MPGPKKAIEIELSEEEQKTLENQARSRTLPFRQVQRARLILRLAQGTSISEAARQTGCRRRIAQKWLKRFAHERLKGLLDLPRTGRPPVFSPSGGGLSGQIGLPDA